MSRGKVSRDQTAAVEPFASRLAAGVMVVLLAWGALSFSARPLRDGARLVASTLVETLEGRFDRVAVSDWTSVDGVVILGGGGNTDRLEAGRALLRAHPHLRAIVSGAAPWEIGIVRGWETAVLSRVTFETKSAKVYQNTYGNAIFSREIIDHGGDGGRWLLVTSASHMPRAIGTFRRAGVVVEPWPVADRDRRLSAMVAIAVHEWAGLVEYRALGRSSELLPSPS